MTTCRRIIHTPKKFALLTGVVGALNLLTLGAAHAHAIVGDRVFPATLVIDDPGVDDELTLPQVTLLKQQNDNGQTTWTTTTAWEFDKRLTNDFQLSIDGDYFTQDHGPAGWDNLGVGAKYLFLKEEAHELMMSFELDADLGHTGSRYVADQASTVSPALYIGKGLGDMANPFSLLRPFAITGTLGAGLPIGGDDPTTVQYGLTVQYSLPYLQQHVKDIGLGAPFNNLIPLVEVAFSTPVNQGEHPTTGTVNPGVIWLGYRAQFGLEATLPVNSASGSGVGVIAQVHFFLDDIFPQTVGKPLLASR